MINNKKNSFFLLLFQLLLCFKIIKSFGLRDLKGHLLLFFKYEEKDIENKVLSEENYINELMYKELYSTFNLGLPNQNLKFQYDMNNYESYISEEFYFKKRSTTYKLIEKNDIKGNLSQELLDFSETIKLKNLTFYLKPKKSIYINSIGLNLYSNNTDNSFSFLSSLKKENLINQEIFSFLFGDESFSDSKIYDGQLLLGYYPHEISPDFDEEGLQFYSVKNKFKKWSIEFDKVKYNDDELENKIMELDINLNLVIGPNKFRKKLISDFGFFKEFIDNKKCKESYFVNKKDNETYIFYSFDNDIQFKEVPKLSFYSKELNETFIISFADLFVKYRNRYYFKIIFKKKPFNNWIFGQLFFNNYKFVFDLEERKIGYYKTYSKANHPIIVLICFAVFGLIFIIGYCKGYSYRVPNQPIPPVNIRKEYEQAPTDDNKSKKEDNKKIKEKKD